MNLLRQSRINLCQSAYTALVGKLNFNTTPLTSIGTEAIIFQARANQTTSYSNHVKNEWYVGPCLDEFWNYKVYVTSIEGAQESNCVNFFPIKSRLPNADSINQLSAALEDLKHKYTPSNTNHPVVKSKHGTDLNRAIKRMKQLFHPAITTTSNLINNISSPKVTYNLIPRVVRTLFPRVKTVPKHNNSISQICQPGVVKATNQYTSVPTSKNILMVYLIVEKLYPIIINGTNSDAKTEMKKNWHTAKLY